MIDFPNDESRGHFAAGVYYADLANAARDARTQTRIADWIVRQLGGTSFQSADELQDFACARAVAFRGRALSSDVHARLVWAARDVWFASAPSARYEITERGRAALRNTVAV